MAIFTTAGTRTLPRVYAGDINFTNSTSQNDFAHGKHRRNHDHITAHTPNPWLVNQAITVNFTVTINSPGQEPHWEHDGQRRDGDN